MNPELFSGRSPKFTSSLMLLVLAPGRAGLGQRLPIPEALGGERSAPLRARCLGARLAPFGQRWLLGFLPR